MARMTFKIPSQGHTLGCLIRDGLFQNGATFAACTVPHPQDTFLVVEIDHPDDCEECLLSTLRETRLELERYKAAIATKRVNDDLMVE